MAKHLRQDVTKPRVSFEDCATILVICIVFLVAAIIVQNLVEQWFAALQS